MVIVMITKGKMIKALKAAGVRRGDKDGSSVGLEHLKTFAITTMYFDTFGGLQKEHFAN